MNAVIGSFGVDSLVPVPEDPERASKASMINAFIVIFLGNSKGTDEVTEEIGLANAIQKGIVFQKDSSRTLLEGKGSNSDPSKVDLIINLKDIRENALDHTQV